MPIGSIGCSVRVRTFRNRSKKTVKEETTIEIQKHDIENYETAVKMSTV